jgi:tRNA G18 (ribose-2'-O)-methylase SpoU
MSMESSGLERLLCLSSVLLESRDDSGSASNSNSLTLKQLISVHESLLNSVVIDNRSACTDAEHTDSTDHNDHKKKDVSSIVNRLVKNEKDAQICKSILSSPSNNNRNNNKKSGGDSNVLLVVQYLLRLSKLRSNHSNLHLHLHLHFLDGLKNVTFPLLLASPQYDGLLRDAIMDASFSSSNTNTSGGVDVSGGGGVHVHEDYNYNHNNENDHDHDNERPHEENTAAKGGHEDCSSLALQQFEECLQLVYDSTVNMLQTPMNVHNNNTNTNDDASASLSWINIVVGISSRVMERLLNLSKNNQQKQLVLKYMHNLIMAILNALCFYSNAAADAADGTGTGTGTGTGSHVRLKVNCKTNMFMRPITALLLPAILEQQSEIDTKRHTMDELWEFICFLVDPSPAPSPVPSPIPSPSPASFHAQNMYDKKRKCRSWAKTASSVSSALLCIMAGEIHSLPLIVPTHRYKEANLYEYTNNTDTYTDTDTDTDTDTKMETEAKETASSILRIPIIQHPTFWNFIQTSLTSGSGSGIGDEISSGSGAGAGSEGRGMKGGGGFHGHAKAMSNPYPSGNGNEHGNDMRAGVTANANGAGAGVNGAGVGGGVNAGTNAMEEDYDCDTDVDQMVRRRAIHILSIVIDKKYHEMKAKEKGGDHDHDNDDADADEEDRMRIDTWKKYIMCFEALEMEVEVHLVDQVWSTVVELCAACVGRDTSSNGPGNATHYMLPKIAWDWVGALFARVLMSHSPTLRKLGLFRLFLGEAGIKLEDPNGNGNGDGSNGGGGGNSDANDNSDGNNASQQKANSSKSSQGKKGKGKGKKKGKAGKMKVEPAPISIISPAFVLYCLIPSFDSLASSVGTGVNFEVNGKVRNNDLSKMLPPFLTQYTKALLRNGSSDRLRDFVEGLLGEKFLLSTKARSLVLIFNSVLQAWEGDKSIKITLSSGCIKDSVAAFQTMYQGGSVVFDFRQSLLLDFSRILSYSVLADGKKPDPELVLDTLALYPAAEELTEPSTYDLQTSLTLNSWLRSFGEDWVVNAGAACASSFISGYLVPFHEGGDEKGLVVTSSLARQRGAAIAKLCALSGSFEDSSPSSLLWPSINKGLQYSSPLGQDLLPLSKEFGQKVARAIVLLQYGCQERVLSGIGHGDLVLDKDGNMMPLPPAIEVILSRAVNFTLDQLRRVSICNYHANQNIATSKSTYGGRSTKSGEFAGRFTHLIRQLMVLKKSYPSSVTMEVALNKLLRKSIDVVITTNDAMSKGESTQLGVNGSVDMVKNMSIIYGVLTLGAELSEGELESEEEKDHITEICSAFLGMKFRNLESDSSQVATWQVKSMRSIFELAKWGCLYYLVPMAYSRSNSSLPASRELHDQIINVALDSVNACPANALPVLFETAVSSAKQSFDMFTDEEKLRSNAYAKNIGRIIDTFFSIMNDTAKNSTRAYMLNVTCSLIFSPKSVSDEFASLQRIKDGGGKVNMRINAPIFQAFRKLIEQAGSSKPHISKYVMSYISAGWLGDQEEKAKIGLAAIPYRQDIAKLLIHKEEKQDKSTAQQEGLVKAFNEGNSATLPDGVPHSSMARGFLMVFISKLPDPDDMGKNVLEKLCHYLIMWLLDNICLVNERSGKVLLTTGSLEYVQKIRAWQSLCMLHRFVTPDIAHEVMKKVFETMSPHLHGPIRYWIEVFTIQISRTNPLVFVDLFQEEIKRRDITQQHVSSLMIIGGNLFAGKYSNLFIKSITDNNATILRDVIVGSVPWLSSTQGFSRAIAQLLVHKLIPLAEDKMIHNNDSFLLETIFQFLESNNEMKRLRNKQSSFFDSYDVDMVCTPEGMFSIDLDDGEESYPPHLVDILKKCLVDISSERKGSDAPDWKQVENEMESLRLEENDVHDFDEDNATSDNSDDALVNFQRKILPIDTLNLTLEDQKKAQTRNAAGRKRQSLIVCASLIDKVTNLAGLTRTAEIFAAEKIVVPDAKVKKMDNFKNIAVGAEDWIEIEECKEKDLLPWLKERKKEGYSIIGIEQTNSSSCLSHVQFEQKSILLLGKEKEGIPVELLQFVDKCVEIPQLGIIRSLNVHVSGAISIWEYTKQMMA